MEKTFCQITVSILTPEDIEKVDTLVGGLNCNFKHIERIIAKLGLKVEVVDVNTEYENIQNEAI